ncbi:MAG: efflux RND transporter permease subunit, partial [Acidobacteriota bacterium]
GVGMLVDNAVVVMENIHRLQDRGVDAVEAARRGTRQVVLAVIAATATTVCVWAWLFFQGRSQMTIYMGQVALTICSAVVCSLIISLTFIPLATARFVPSQPSAPGWIMRRLVPAYRAVLRWTLRHRLVTLIVLLLLASTAALPIIKIEKSGEPKEQQLFAQVFFRSQDPTTKEAMEAHVVKMESWVEANRDTLDFDSLYSWFTERGMGVVRLYLKPEDATDAKVAELTAAMRAGLPPIAGLRYEFGQNRWWNRGSGNRRMVSVALHGEDPEYLQRLAAEVEPALLTLPDAIDAFGRATNGLYEAQVRIDPERARTLGVSPQQVAETVSLTYRGRNLRRFQRDATELEMLVMLPEDLQPGLASLEDLPIARDLPLPGALRIDPSDTVPLGAVADVAVARADVEIQREDRQTSVWLTVEFDKDALTTDEARARVATFMDARDFPEGYGWGWGRWGRDRDNNLATMLIGVALSLATVMLLMAALFESFTQPLAIVITLPLAFFGSFWVLWLGGYELDIAAFMGVIILIGIVVNNGIVLVDRVNQLRGQGMARETALLQGCGDRLRPVMMTAISTIVGLAPLAYSGFTVAMAVVDSLAVAVIGGLATSTLFTLIGLPVWYVTLEDLGQGFLRALPRRTPAALPASSSSSAAAGG